MSDDGPVSAGCSLTLADPLLQDVAGLADAIDNFGKYLLVLASPEDYDQAKGHTLESQGVTNRFLRWLVSSLQKLSNKVAPGELAGKGYPRDLPPLLYWHVNQANSILLDYATNTKAGLTGDRLEQLGNELSGIADWFRLVGTDASEACHINLPTRFAQICDEYRRQTLDRLTPPGDKWQRPVYASTISSYRSAYSPRTTIHLDVKPVAKVLNEAVVQAAGISSAQVEQLRNGLSDLLDRMQGNAVELDGVATDKPGLQGHLSANETDIEQLESEAPELDKGNGQWVKNKKAAQIESLEVETLRRYRQGGTSNSESTFGCDNYGRIWRRAGKPHSHPWYLKSTLIAEQQP